MAVQSLHVGFSHQGLGRARTADLLPATYPLTVIYNAYVDTDTPTEYHTFFAMGPTTFTGGADYYTTAMVQSTPASNMSVGVNGSDNVAAQVVTGVWMAHALRCFKDSDTHHEFYYGLPDLAKMVDGSVSGTSYFNAVGSTTFMRFGDVEWADNETLAGRIRGAKIFQCKLPTWACVLEAQSPFPVLPQFAPLLWGCWPLRTAADRFDISGNGRHLYIPGSGISPTTIADSPHMGDVLDNPYAAPELSIYQAAAGGGSIFSRKTLSGIGTRTGSRQLHGW